MSEIREVLKPAAAGIKVEPVFVCAYTKEDFMFAKTINIYDKNGNVAKITKFGIGETKQCFNHNPVSPIVKINEDIDPAFLQIGNKVEFAA